MSQNEMITKIEQLRAWEALLEEAQVEIEALRDNIKAEMLAQNTEELQVGTYIIRWTSVLSNRFDSTSFKKEYGLAMDGNLKIELVIENKLSNDKLDRSIAKKENLELNIPLTSLTIEVPIESNVKDTKGYLVNELVYNDHIIFTILEYLSYLMFSVVAVGITYLIVIIIKSESIYNRKLNKILKTYDGILVEINALPKLKNMEIISVKSFNELIDAHSEIRKPISFVKNINSVTFILINEGIVWTYTLNKRAYKEEV